MESPTAPQHLETSCPRSVRQGPSEAGTGWVRGQLGETEAHGKEKDLCSQFLERARVGYPVRAELDNGVRRLGTLGCGQWGAHCWVWVVPSTHCSN